MGVLRGQVNSVRCQGAQYLPSFVQFGVCNDEVGCVGDAEEELLWGKVFKNAIMFGYLNYNWYLWLKPKVLPLGNKNKFFIICFVFRSLICTFVIDKYIIHLNSMLMKKKKAIVSTVAAEPGSCYRLRTLRCLRSLRSLKSELLCRKN